MDPRLYGDDVIRRHVFGIYPTMRRFLRLDCRVALAMILVQKHQAQRRNVRN